MEHLAGACFECLQKRPDPSPVLHPWDWPEQPWKRVPIDFAGPFLNHMFLVVIDAHSKWPEVVHMASTATIWALGSIFSRYGFPEQLVIDNGPQLTTVRNELKIFLKSNGIRRITNAPRHPSSNGIAERFVQTLKKARLAMKGKLSLSDNLNKFLIMYRNSPHTLTNEPPALLLIGWRFRMRLDLVKPNLKRHVDNKVASIAKYQRSPAEFKVRDKVAVRDN